MANTGDSVGDLARDMIAKAMELDAAAVADDASIDTLDTWDSLNHLRLLTAIEEHLGQELPPEAVVEIASYADVVAVLERFGAAA